MLRMSISKEKSRDSEVAKVGWSVGTRGGLFAGGRREEGERKGGMEAPAQGRAPSIVWRNEANSIRH